MRGLFLPTLAALLVMATTTLAADKTIRVVNRASEEILFVFAKNPEDFFWGNDRLKETIWRGRAGKVVVSDGIQCTRSLKAIGRSGRAAELDGVDVCAMDVWTIEDKNMK
jgi:hypothetical protein